MVEHEKKILIVEDEEDIRQALAAELRIAGFTVFEARNGKEGLQNAVQKKPDLILLDIVMPVMDGMTMMKALRKDAWGKNAAIILLTNLSANDKIIEGIVSDEPLYYLVKSDWKIGNVVAKIKESLMEQQQRTAERAVV